MSRDDYKNSGRLADHHLSSQPDIEPLRVQLGSFDSTTSFPASLPMFNSIDTKISRPTANFITPRHQRRLYLDQGQDNQNMRIVDLANSRTSLKTVETDRKKERAAIIEKYAVHMKMIEETQVGMGNSSS